MGEIGDWSAGSTPSRKEIKYYQKGIIPWLKTGDLNDSFINETSEFITELAIEENTLRLNPIGSVLIAMYGATIGKLGLLNIEATTNQACCACIPFSGINNRFLFFYLLSQKQNIQEKAEGGAQPNISKEKLINILFPLPPLSEQRRIVEKIEELLALVDDLETNKTDLQSYIKQAKSKILEMAIRGELVPQNPEDEPASVLLERIKKEQKSSKSKGKNTAHNTHYEEESSMINKKVPNGWEICFLRDISSNISSKPYQILQSEVKIRSDIPVVSQSSNYIEGYSDQKNKLFVVDNFVIIFGDHTRNIKYIDFDFIVGADGVKIIKPYKYVTKYIYYLLVNVSEKIENRGYSRHFQFLEKYPLNFPPLEEQHRIVEKIEEIFSELEFIEEALI